MTATYEDCYQRQQAVTLKHVPSHYALRHDTTAQWARHMLRATAINRGSLNTSSQYSTT